MDFLQTVRVFVAVVEARSFAKAADNITSNRPTVTNAVKALETTLGVRLLNRTTRSLSLTPQGEVFYERALSLLQEVADARSLFRPCSNDSAVKGKLRIDVPAALASTLLIPRLKGFVLRYPAIDLVIGVSDTTANLVSEGIDCVIRVGELKDSNMVGRPLTMAPMVTCASPAYLAQHGAPSSLRGLAQHKSVSYFFGTSRRVMEWNFETEDGIESIHVPSGLLLNDSVALVQAAVAGLGIVQVLRTSVQQHLDDGSLVAVLPDYTVPPRQISVLYHEKRLMGQPLRQFLDWVPSVFSGTDFFDTDTTAKRLPAVSKDLFGTELVSF